MPAGSWFLACRAGRFELRVADRLLLQDDVQVTIRKRAFDLLLTLVEAHGQLVPKDRLLERVWPRRIVEENALQSQVSSLRKLLGPDAIATVSGHGYRLVAEVSEAGPEAPVLRTDNLPHELSRFIGREKELAELAASLETTRLLTLTGAGGCGKTRLSLQLGTRMTRVFADGVLLVELAGLAEPGLVIQAFANVLAVAEQPGRRQVDLVAQAIGARRLLLLVDNAEHLLDATATVATTLLQRCPGLVILATSRERLAVEGELVYRVPSLTLPDASGNPALDAIVACESAKLFIDRARLSVPDFAVTARTAPALASICRHLDGIALAIELAVPHLNAMSLEELDRSLDDRFTLLSGGMRARLPRQRTLRGLIDWSHALLSDDERTLFRRLSVFRGWTRDAACALCSDARLDAQRVASLLDGFVDKSLVVLTDSRDNSASRYRLLETVQLYAHERLLEAGEDDDLQRRQLRLLCASIERLTHDGPQTESMHLIDLERDNLRAALGGSIGSPDRSADGLRLATALGLYWRWRGLFTEGREWLASLLAATSGEPASELRAAAFVRAGSLATMQGDYVAARRCQEASLAIQRELGNERGIAKALSYLAWIAQSVGEHARSRQLRTEVLAIARRLGERSEIGLALMNLGYLACEEGDYPTARGWLEESQSVMRELDHWQVGHAIFLLGVVAYCESDFASAHRHLEHALAGHRAADNQPGIAECLAVIGMVAHDTGDHRLALDRLQEALRLQKPMNDRRNIAESLEAFAAVAARFNALDLAARIWGCTERLREQIGAPVTPSQRAWYERQIGAARTAACDAGEFDRAWQAGRATHLEEAVEDALEFTPPARDPHTG